MIIFGITILFIMIAYLAWTNGGTIEIMIHPAEMALKALVIFPFVLALSMFFLCVELYRLAMKRGLILTIKITILIMAFITFFLFTRISIFWEK